MTYQDYTRGAERALAQFMEEQRLQRVASDILEQGFRDGEINAGTISGPEAEPNYEDAKQAAREYAQARNSGARVRHYNEHNASAREGVQAALEFIERRRASKIRK